MPWQPQNLMNQRLEFALKALRTENFRALCREYGISPEVGYKWRDRLLQNGVEGFGELSRRPHSSPGKLSQEVVCRMVRLKERHRAWGPRKIREIYRRQWGNAPSESSFKRVLEDCGLSDKRVLRRKASETGRVASGRKASACNEVWTVDFKGWWYDREGRCTPLTVCDEHSRYILELRAVADARSATIRACFERLFERYGLPCAIRSDNGPPFAASQGLLGLSQLSAWWLANGIDLERGRPACPQDNGSHERMHGDIAKELEKAGYAERQSAFDTWRREYNEERPHETLGMRMPAEVYQSGTRPWKGTPEEISYPGMMTRKINASGHLKYEGEMIFVSHALNGWQIGLKARKDGTLDVYFSRLLLGHLEPQTSSFVPVQRGTQDGAQKPKT